MFNSPLPSDPDLLKSLLEPLLEDFQYWFGRSQALLENERITFLEESQQANLLERVLTAQKEVTTTQTLLNATDGKVGVETDVLMNWHRLVHECWGVSMKHRSNQVQ
ncbi:DUF2605 domain-containing protein [Alkalinema sp. FACHB-956]|uniref:DUF2605 domain-containing protein n=1 Tax=Alkalinema sp. FACHB-956 TaxID=2692768 RepID=UPI0016887FC7|nr:DUF2605 domain-containing protein [Alkalinema sp. FACHB-956]MBD2327207.1 DUF2605 domain-containing protein [Alkalinema sp. FACHB-956]